MIGQNMIDRLYDCQVIDPRGEKIGAVKQVWLDGSTGEAVWASVHTGLFGLKETFVPLQRAELRDDEVQVPVAKEQVKEAPRIDTAGDRMSEADQAALRAHYGLPGSGGSSGRGGTGNGGGNGAGNGGGTGRQGNGQDGRQNVRRPGSAPESTRAGGGMASGMAGGITGRPGEKTGGRPGGTGRGGDVAMTRSEERLKVGTEEVETGRVRLVKHVVTEHQQVTVPVSHEEVHVEREPITDGRPGQKLGEGRQEVTLHAERPVVGKETVAVENVRLAKERVTGEQTVSDEVSKERIDIEDDSHKRR
jgi:uncharacterized protein (TIGR02271 family)